VFSDGSLRKGEKCSSTTQAQKHHMQQKQTANSLINWKYELLEFQVF